MLAPLLVAFLSSRDSGKEQHSPEVYQEHRQLWYSNSKPATDIAEQECIYGYHGSQLSKATLLLAADKLVKENPGVVSYFPAYEIMNDELRDYRFYKEDMLHPSEQAVEYIWERFRTIYF